ncbi:MAG TPA: hypothetical protein VGK73_13150, partial [Polyangiaceae bacterium]
TLARRDVAGLRDAAASAGDADMHATCEHVLAAYDAQAFRWPLFVEHCPKFRAAVDAIIDALNNGEG